MQGTPPNRLGELIEASERTKAGDVAAHCSVDPSTVWRWRTGQSPIPDEQKLRLAGLFEVTVAYLMGWEAGVSVAAGAPHSTVGELGDAA